GTANNTLSADSPLQQNLGSTLQEVQRAMRSLRVLTDYLGVHPESLLRGRQADQEPAMSRLRPWIPLAAALGLAGCASAPLHYYTLMTPAGSTAGNAAAPAPYPFELLPVGVPAQVDVPQLVVREGGQGVQPLDGQRWIAPLGDEV